MGGTCLFLLRVAEPGIGARDWPQSAQWPCPGLRTQDPPPENITCSAMQGVEPMWSPRTLSIIPVRGVNGSKRRTVEGQTSGLGVRWAGGFLAL